MNNKGQTPEFTITNMIIAILIGSLFITLVGAMINTMSGGYDISTFNQTELDNFNKHDNLSNDIVKAHNIVDDVVVNPSWFDVLSGVFDALTQPFKTVYRSFSTIIGLTTSSVDTLELHSSIGDFFITALTVIVIIGFVMFRIWMGRRG